MPRAKPKPKPRPDREKIERLRRSPAITVAPAEDVSFAPAKGTEVATAPAQETAQVVPVNDAAAIWAVIERMAGNPAVDAEKLDRLLKVQERLMDRNAVLAFNQAFVAMQPELPIIRRDGSIIVKEKDARGERTGKTTQDTPYAKWETIDAAVKPILHRHGFAISHRISTAPSGDRVRVTAIVRHVGGHVDDSCYFDLPADASGSKNNAQAWASSVSYGKRHSGVAALNIITREEDDDGKKSGRPVVVGDPLSPEEFGKVMDLVEAVECPPKHFLAHMNKVRPRNHPEAEKIDDLPASRFDEAIEALRSFEANKKERDQMKTARGRK